MDRLRPGRAGQFNKLENMLLSDATAVANVDRIVPHVKHAHPDGKWPGTVKPPVYCLTTLTGVCVKPQLEGDMFNISRWHV
eukprot:scaffold9776_cov126-Isochrysis_galbana.AAC.6